MSNKIIQLQPWRDIMLALTEQGEIYMLKPTSNYVEQGLTPTLLFSGIPVS